MPAFTAEPPAPQLDPALRARPRDCWSTRASPGCFSAGARWARRPSWLHPAGRTARRAGVHHAAGAQRLATHPLHVGMGFGDYAVPAAANAFADWRLPARGGHALREEIPTGSYSMRVPAKLIHLDINPQVFGANYPARARASPWPARPSS
ncbi:Acetolactate synthase large subunit OS=Stutzerimonas stutzeri OX=316 GN=CXK95_18495 PE=3 SV=1 [Stutzerimonas stutzeri]